MTVTDPFSMLPPHWRWARNRRPLMPYLKAFLLPGSQIQDDAEFLACYSSSLGVLPISTAASLGNQSGSVPDTSGSVIEPLGQNVFVPTYPHQRHRRVRARQLVVRPLASARHWRRDGVAGRSHRVLITGFCRHPFSSRQRTTTHTAFRSDGYADNASQIQLVENAPPSEIGRSPDILVSAAVLALRAVETEDRVGGTRRSARGFAG